MIEIYGEQHVSYSGGYEVNTVSADGLEHPASSLFGGNHVKKCGVPFDEVELDIGLIIYPQKTLQTDMM